MPTRRRSTDAGDAHCFRLVTIAVVVSVTATACTLFGPAPPAGNLGSPGMAAPAECGFEPGAALAYAGRATTSALNVQEVVGDPMSLKPADIYITRDAFSQGENSGQLVCAIYVDTPDFVEVTVVPTFPRTPLPTVEDVVPSFLVPKSTAPPTDISQDDAIDIAQSAARGADWTFERVDSGPAAALAPMLVVGNGTNDMPATRWIWSVSLERRGSFTFVVIDYVNGTVYSNDEMIP